MSSQPVPRSSRSGSTCDATVGASRRTRPAAMAHAGVRGDMPARLASSGVGVTVSSRARIVACPTDGAHLSLLTPNAPLRARDDPGAPLPGPYGLLLASVLASVAVQGTFSPSGFAQVLISVLLGLNLLLA